MKTKKVHYTKRDIVKSLKELDLNNGDNIFIHSNIGFFGKLDNADTPDEYYQIFKEAIFEIIGKEGTMVNPSFSYSFCNGDDFDIDNTKGLCGIFAESARLDPESKRSHDANFSVVAIGANASFFTENASEYSFGEDSFWARFMELEGKIVNFNFDSASTMIHYVEREHKVSYRYDKAFKGNYNSKGIISRKVFFHYVYDLAKNENAAYFPKFDTKAKKKGLVRISNLGRGQLLSIGSRDTYNLISEELLINPAFLIKADSVERDIKSSINTYFDRLFPINRSLTGDGNRESLDILAEIADINISEIKSGTQCFDWTVPAEWKVKAAWIETSKGQRLIDFNKNNLHLLGYSIQFSKDISYTELKDHIYTLPDQPEAIPYLTSYYQGRWGFCMSHKQFDTLDKEDVYRVHIDSEMDYKGSMTIGEAIIKGESEDEVLISTYICHPSMANNELSGPLVSAFLYKQLKGRSKLKYTYRFLFLPETIGSIYYLSKNGDKLKKSLKAGYVLTCLGDRGNFTYKRSRQGNSLSDRAAELVLNQSQQESEIIDFFPSGSDERQYCSPGFDLPVGSLMRTMYARYKEYHSSEDNKSFISFESIEGSINKYLDIIEVIESNFSPYNTMPMCEPQLGKRGLYPTLGSQKDSNRKVEIMMWILNLADGSRDLISIAEQSGIPYKELLPVIDTLFENGIIR